MKNDETNGLEGVPPTPFDDLNYHCDECEERAALKTAQKTYGLLHPKVADSLQSLALTICEAHLYNNEGPPYDFSKYDEVETLYNQALYIYIQTLGPNHQVVANCLQELAVFYGNVGEYDKALPIILQHLKIVEGNLGLDSPELSYILVDMGATLYVMGRYIEALSYGERAISILEKAGQTNSSTMANALKCVSDVYMKIGRQEEALQLIAQGEAILTHLSLPNLFKPF